MHRPRRGLGGVLAVAVAAIAFALAFKAADRTLSADDAAALRARLVEAVRERFDAQLRSV